jgi:hypothetical protein
MMNATFSQYLMMSHRPAVARLYVNVTVLCIFLASCSCRTSVLKAPPEFVAPLTVSIDGHEWQLVAITHEDSEFLKSYFSRGEENIDEVIMTSACLCKYINTSGTTRYYWIYAAADNHYWLYLEFDNNGRFRQRQEGIGKPF